MPKQEKDVKATELRVEKRPAHRPWVTPTFERVDLEEALTGGGNLTFSDLVTYGS
ncbi:MAG: hypothetical protein HYX94_11600 [Chloroflexi bacterium]|nr:hypothetical protein [Chloroflexota bacterium]